MKNGKLTLLITGALFLFVISLASCSKEDTGEPASNTTNNNNSGPKPVWKDSLARMWVVTAATNNGKDDQNSKGLRFLFKKDGTYDFNNGDYAGTWEFTDSTYNKILLDKDVPSLKTTWTVTTFTAKKISTDFKSPFNGGNSHWDLTAQ
ncbi:MAG TPA: hypothetical protein VEC12_03340 [Bacteroidia bacterium]|nr:hypothetical protein [Bacteroidia bacterium]